LNSVFRLSAKIGSRFSVNPCKYKIICVNLFSTFLPETVQNTFLHKVGRSFLDVQCVADCNQLVDAGSGVSFFPFTDFLVTDIDAIVAEKFGESYARLADLLVTKCRDAAALAAQPFDAVVDALYGTGFHGSLRPAGLAACALMNRQRESGAFVLAVDLPSGINTKSTFPYICIANKGKCFCLAHYEVTIAKDTVNSQ
jgi:hypothetical protein